MDYKILQLIVQFYTWYVSIHQIRYVKKLTRCNITKQDRSTYNVTLRSVLATIIAVESNE
jgi:hypothetical protein